MTEQEQKSLIARADQPIVALLESMSIEKRLADILLYALGMSPINLASNSSMTARDFFHRIAKYLRSIGYYGSSPFMMCNYGSSEYAQAFSRIGSLYGNVYIVNEELDL
jgi:RAB protein geranylgeranyltransferase component A